MPRSMTGFGRGRWCCDGKEFLVEIKTVNHRYTDIGIKLTRQISFLEEKVREYINQNVSRGKVDVFVTYEDKGEKAKNVFIDEALAGTYVSALEALREKFNLEDDITVGLVSRLPDVFKVEKQEDDEEEIWQVLSRALGEAVQSLLKMREKEGLELKKDLVQRADYILELLKEVSGRAPEVVKEYKQKLENRIKELLDQNVVDENRLVMEVAIFADRCSIDEETVRLASHIEQMRASLDSANPVGRKLDFLVQEMNREANTIGSKANDLTITRNIVDIKSEIEKIREQIQNIE